MVGEEEEVREMESGAQGFLWRYGLEDGADEF